MGLSNYIASSRISQAGVIPNSAARPASPYEGQMVYQTDTKQLLIWDGTAWVMAVDTDTPPGLQLVKTYSITSGTSVTLTDCFPSDFTSFRLVAKNIDTSGDGGLFIQFTTTGNSHYGTLYYDGYGGGATGVVRQNNAQQMEISLIDNANCSIDITNPNVATQTTWFGTYFGRSLYSGWCGGMHNVNTAYSSCNITTGTSGATFSAGTISVYGYRN